ncbi:carbonic anhydrase [Streptomyces vinaceus]|uniref:carbonic anhydrase n=1 Tax=Streptomyces vinaceus TaxID=1960 RepID=UPI00382CE5E1
MESLIARARAGGFAGNIVPRYTAGRAVAATLEYAVTALNVPDTLVYAHTRFGAVRTLPDHRALERMPLVDRRLPDAARRGRPRTGRGDQGARAQLATRPAHVRSYSCAARDARTGALGPL